MKGIGHIIYLQSNVEMLQKSQMLKLFDNKSAANKFST
jgi:hypothetical protein